MQSPSHDPSAGDAACDHYRLAFESAPTAMLIVDESGTIVRVNSQTERLFGYTRSELLGMQLRQLLPTHVPNEPGASLVTATDTSRELRGLRKNGTEMPVEISVNALFGAPGTLLATVVDLTAHKRWEEQLRERTADLTNSLRERDVMLHEIHHRVKNNLQVISSLISMQSRKLTDEAARRSLNECKTRVQAIALIHEKLYESKDFTRVPFSDYVRRLAHNVFQAAGKHPGSIALKLDVDNLSLPVDKAIPCGLILNELIANALQYAFPDGRAGTVRIELRQIRPDRVRLAVCDDGIGIPEPYRTGAQGSLGMQLVTTLSKQLAGTFDINMEGGTSVQVDFPVSVSTSS